MHVAAYDIQCQYRIHFDSRMDELRSTLSQLQARFHLKAFPWTIAGVGKFHLAGHKGDCQFCYNFKYLPGAAMTDGEAAERIWSAVNPLGARTREMNPGHRHDIMNQFYGDWNVRRVHGMGECTTAGTWRVWY